MKQLFTYVLFLFGLQSLAQKPELLPDSLKICQGDSILLDIQQGYDNYASVYWTTPAGIITNTSKLIVKKQGRYAVKVESAYFSKQIRDSVYLMVLPRPLKHLRDTVLCGNSALLLSTRYSNFYHLWSTGEKTPKIEIKKEGLYWVKVSNGVCSVTDTIQVRAVNKSPTLLPKELSFCLNEPNKIISVKVSPGTRLLWSTGSNSYSTAVSSEGIYWVQSTLAPCGEFRDSTRVVLKLCECEMMIPNSFTPNEDNRNDYFFPVAECEYSYFNMSISDRWGNAIFSTYQSNGKWDGRFKGNLCPEDVYVYKIETIEKGTDKKQVRTGHVSLFR
ncbi:MAG: gliding motility-associated C-terminal domain-containing protein [Bacteroidia bacterium]|nr:gliding motility-associated C-terminal domain-containing protein [Bacteroidia bacterium]